MSNGFVLYEGPSELNGDPIVAIATFKSRNAKTGNMAQVWIIRQDIHPVEAISEGVDDAICGDCPLRPVNTGKCYVNVGQAPAAVWRAYQAGNYPRGDASMLAGYDVRNGAYGDPAALPTWVNLRLAKHAAKLTGYTHQWRRFKYLRDWCMASVHSPEERREANELGFRCFRTRTSDEPVMSYEVICPASREAGQKLTCKACTACGGLSSKARADVVIIEH